MNRLSRAGFKGDFVRPAILPEWWENNCAQDPSLIQEIEIRIARFLGLPLSVVKDADSKLVPSNFPAAQLRGVRVTDHERLGPAIHAAMRIAAAVVRSLRNSVPDPIVPPSDGLIWRAQIERNASPVTLHDMALDLWKRGIPVIPLEVLPAPSFQGIACIAEGRPCILVGHKHDEPGRVAFLIAHETGHVAAGDCTPDQLILDEDVEVENGEGIEGRTERYAIHTLAGDNNVPKIAGADFRELARNANDVERETGADATLMIFTWARRTGEYQQAAMALKALWRSTGARKLLLELFNQHVDLESATESDYTLLRCVHGDS